MTSASSSTKLDTLVHDVALGLTNTNTKPVDTELLSEVSDHQWEAWQETFVSQLSEVFEGILKRETASWMFPKYTLRQISIEAVGAFYKPWTVFIAICAPKTAAGTIDDLAVIHTLYSLSTERGLVKLFSR